MRLRMLFPAVAVALLCLGAPRAEAAVVVIEFTGVPLGPFAGHFEDGFAVGPAAGPSIVIGFGSPAPGLGTAPFSTSVVTLFRPGGGRFELISFDVNKGGTVPAIAASFLDGVLQEMFFYPETGGVFVPTAPGFTMPLDEVRFDLLSVVSPSTTSVELDNFVVNPVPTPAAAPLALAAMGVLAARRRRR